MMRREKHQADDHREGDSQRYADDQAALFHELGLGPDVAELAFDQIHLNRVVIGHPIIIRRGEARWPEAG